MFDAWHSLALQVDALNAGRDRIDPQPQAKSLPVAQHNLDGVRCAVGIQSDGLLRAPFAHVITGNKTRRRTWRLRRFLTRLFDLNGDAVVQLAIATGRVDSY